MRSVPWETIKRYRPPKTTSDLGAPPMPKETYLAVTLVARIHPGDREAIDETLQKVLCPLGHFDEPGDQPWPDHTECRMDWYSSTVVGDLETALTWCVPEVEGLVSEPTSP